MARDLDASLLAEVTAAATRVVFLYEAEFSSGTTRAWTGVGDLSWNGETWTGVGRLGGHEVAVFHERRHSGGEDAHQLDDIIEP